VIVSQLGRNTAPGRPLKETDLQQVRLVHIFDRIDLFAEHRGYRIHPNRAAAEPFDDGSQQFPIDVIEAVLIDIQKLQSIAGNRRRDFTCSSYLRKIANTLQ
jgi:hypothetical protein